MKKKKKKKKTKILKAKECLEVTLKYNNYSARNQLKNKKKNVRRIIKATKKKEKKRLLPLETSLKLEVNETIVKTKNAKIKQLHKQ